MKKQSIATLAEALGKKKGKWEKLAESPDKIKQNTAKYKLNRIDTLFDSLFELQESMKPVSKDTPMMRKGGNLPKAMYGWPEFNIPEEEYIDDIPFDTSKIATRKVMRQYKNPELFKVGEFVKDNATSIAQGVGMLGDFINQMHYINKMEEPKQTAFVPRVVLNKNMDTSAYKRQAVEALRTGYKQTNDLPSNVSASVRGNLLSSYLSAAGDINTQANNYRMQMENQEAGMNQQVSAQNAMILNDLYNRQNMFRNQRVGAKSNAWSGLLGKSQMFAKDIHTENYQKTHLFPLIMKQFSKPVREFSGLEG